MGFWNDMTRRRKYSKMTVPELHREAQASLHRQDVESALEAMLIAFERTPTDPAVCIGLGICCHFHRWNATAIACFRRALDFDPNNEEAKTKMQELKGLIEKTIQDLGENPMFKHMPNRESSYFGSMRRSNEIQTELAYRALCEGRFEPQF